MRSKNTQMSVIVGACCVVLAAAVVAGCDRHRTIDPEGEADQPSATANQPSEASASANTKNQQGAAARPSASDGTDERFSLRTYPSKVAVGSTTRVHFDIVAGDRLKPNKEFGSWSLKLSPGSAASVQRNSFSSSDFGLNDSRARATTAVTVADGTETGQRIEIPAVATFSVCTDETCHVMRDRKISFTLKAVASEPSPPGGSGLRPYR